MGDDIELFLLADALPQFVGFADGFGGARGLTGDDVGGAEARIGHGEIRIQGDRALKQRDGGDGIEPDKRCFEAEIVSLTFASDS